MLAVRLGGIGRRPFAGTEFGAAGLHRRDICFFYAGQTAALGSSDHTAHRHHNAHFQPHRQNGMVLRRLHTHYGRSRTTRDPICRIHGNIVTVADAVNRLGRHLVAVDDAPPRCAALGTDVANDIARPAVNETPRGIAAPNNQAAGK